MEPRLIEPDIRYSASHAAYIEEFNASGEALVPWILESVEDDFSAYVERLNSLAVDVGNDQGRVANSSFWLLDGTQIVAVSNMRHQLTPALLEYGGHIGYSVRPSRRGRGFAKLILRLTLERLRKFGVERARITCDKDNVASAAVIVANGGVLDSEALINDHMVQRYSIPLSGSA